MSLSLLASTAFDTARSTFRAMADAAVPPVADTPAATDSAVPVAAEHSATPPRPLKGQRLGTVLDSYA